MATTSTEVSAIIVPIGEVTLILPSAMVAEILSDRDANVNSSGDAPGWVLGTIDWRGWTVPVLSFDTACDIQESGSQNATTTEKILVLKNPNGGDAQPYIAFIIAAYPQVIMIKPDSISVAPEPSHTSSMISQHVLYNNRQTVIPDFATLNGELSNSVVQLNV